jgi:UDP-2,3-diacylglucosamine hydrolase
MIGPHSQYFVRFQNYFDHLKDLISSGQKIYYVQGNHDFHVQKLYENFFKINKNLNSSLFKISSHFDLRDSGKKIYLCHGDDIELNNQSYKIYKSFVTSPPLTYYANNLMPHFLIKGIGEYSSERSRKRNNLRYSIEADLEPVKENFRKSAEVFFEKSPNDIIVCGHSHVKDHYISPKGFEYVNNGYAQHSKTYISIDNGNISFKPVFL